MSYQNPWSYAGAAEGSAALTAVDASAHRLIAARELQCSIAAICFAAFWSVVSAVALVVVLRIAGHQEWISSALLGVVLAGLAVALGLVRQWRPDGLETVVLADLELHMKQRLSSAYELVSGQPGSPDALRLAEQAVRARLPRHTERVFPLHVPLWGWFIPLACVALVLALKIEIPRAPVSEPARVTSLLSDEGRRLEEFALRMAERASRDNLARSERQARRLERVARGMRLAEVELGTALRHLRELENDIGAERAQALRAARSIGAGALEVSEMSGSSPRTDAWARNMRRLVERLRADASDGAAAAAVAAQVSRGALDETLERAIRHAMAELAAGRDGALDDLLRQLAPANESTGDAEQLERARSEIRRSRQTLGDYLDPDSGSDASGAQSRTGESSGQRGGVDSDGGDSMFEDQQAPGIGTGSGSGMMSEGERAGESDRAPPSDGSVVLHAQSRLSTGPVYSARALVVPRANQARVEREPMDVVSLRARAEAVMSDDSHPLHAREFIRRYFLRLSEGAARPGGERALESTTSAASSAAANGEPEPR